MTLQINKQKALEAIISLRNRIPILKTKEEGSLDYQSWKNEVDDIIMEEIKKNYKSQITTTLKELKYRRGRKLFIQNNHKNSWT